jgi:hypothetical protein
VGMQQPPRLESSGGDEGSSPTPANTNVGRERQDDFRTDAVPRPGASKKTVKRDMRDAARHASTRKTAESSRPPKSKASTRSDKTDSSEADVPATAPEAAALPVAPPAPVALAPEPPQPAPPSVATQPAAPVAGPTTPEPDSRPKTRREVQEELRKARTTGALPRFGNPDPYGPGGAPSSSGD